MRNNRNNSLSDLITRSPSLIRHHQNCPTTPKLHRHHQHQQNPGNTQTYYTSFAHIPPQFQEPRPEDLPHPIVSQELCLGPGRASTLSSRLTIKKNRFYGKKKTLQPLPLPPVPKEESTPSSRTNQSALTVRYYRAPPPPTHTVALLELGYSKNGS